jgi:hypothetical protein
MHKDFASYSIAIDESTDVMYIAQLAVFIRDVNKDFRLAAEFLDLVPMNGTTRADEFLSELVTS